MLGALVYEAAAVMVLGASWTPTAEAWRGFILLSLARGLLAGTLTCMLECVARHTQQPCTFPSPLPTSCPAPRPHVSLACTAACSTGSRLRRPRSSSRCRCSGRLSRRCSRVWCTFRAWSLGGCQAALPRWWFSLDVLLPRLPAAAHMGSRLGCAAARLQQRSAAAARCGWHRALAIATRCACFELRWSAAVRHSATSVLPPHHTLSAWVTQTPTPHPVGMGDPHPTPHPHPAASGLHWSRWARPC